MRNGLFILTVLGIFAYSTGNASAQEQNSTYEDSEYSEYYDSTEEETAQPAEAQATQTGAVPDAQGVPASTAQTGIEAGAEPGAPATGVRTAGGIETPSASDRTAEGIMGFELGINWASSHKLAIELGGCFRRFGIYLLTGLDVDRGEWRAQTAGVILLDQNNPNGGWFELPKWSEKLKYEGTRMLLDIGLAGRVYFLGRLIDEKPNLYLEAAGGYRAAVVNVKYTYQANGDDDEHVTPDGNDLDDASIEIGKEYNMFLKDVANAEEQRLDGVWASLGVGGEYVFKGGFGIAGEAGVFMFYNTEWQDKTPFGYNVDHDEDTTVQWVYANALYKGNDISFDLYYSVALRYHF